MWLTVSEVGVPISMTRGPALEGPIGLLDYYADLCDRYDGTIDLGIIFLPFTTLMYALIWSPTGLTGWDWLWLVFAVIIDVSHWGSSAYANKDRIRY